MLDRHDKPKIDSFLNLQVQTQSNEMDYICVIIGPKQTGKSFVLAQVIRSQLCFFTDVLIKGSIQLCPLKLDCVVLDRYMRWSETILRRDTFRLQMDRLLQDILAEPNDKLSLKHQIFDQEYKVYLLELKKIRSHSFDEVGRLHAGSQPRAAHQRQNRRHHHRRLQQALQVRGRPERSHAHVRSHSCSVLKDISSKAKGTQAHQYLLQVCNLAQKSRSTFITCIDPQSFCERPTKATLSNLKPMLKTTSKSSAGTPAQKSESSMKSPVFSSFDTKSPIR